MRYTRDSSRAEDVLHHLRACDGSFSPPLSARVDIEEYAAKIARKARRIEAWQSSALIGLVAIYIDTPPVGFISNVSVCGEFARRGIARELMRRALEDAAKAGCTTVELELNRNATAVRALYIGMGFQHAPSPASKGDATHRMRLTLPEGGSPSATG